MQAFSGKIAVITGGGTGMGRELARQLTAEGCDVAICDISTEAMQACAEACATNAAQGVRMTSFQCDVANPQEMEAFADQVRTEFATDHINLLFNNAGIAGGGSFIHETQTAWEKTFDVCWGGVYNGSRAFMDLLVASNEGHIVNTSSINGIWASAGPNAAHTAYSAAKYAVKGFTEALITDLRINAPHVKASVVMPGHIGTSILLNTGTHAAAGRAVLKMMGTDDARLTETQVQETVQAAGEAFRDNAPTTAAEAARVILDGVKAEKWRILIGNDAISLDELVRSDPENVYEADFPSRWAAARATD